MFESGIALFFNHIPNIVQQTCYITITSNPNARGTQGLCIFIAYCHNFPAVKYQMNTVTITCMCAAACRSLIRKWTVDELRLRSMSCRRDFTSSHVQATCTKSVQSIQHHQQMDVATSFHLQYGSQLLL